jgi:hypothetical protein
MKEKTLFLNTEYIESTLKLAESMAFFNVMVENKALFAIIIQSEINQSPKTEENIGCIFYRLKYRSFKSGGFIW